MTANIRDVHETLKFRDRDETKTIGDTGQDETRRLSENPATETFKDMSRRLKRDETLLRTWRYETKPRFIIHYLLYPYNTNTCKQQKPSNTVYYFKII